MHSFLITKSVLSFSKLLAFSMFIILSNQIDSYQSQRHQPQNSHYSVEDDGFGDNQNDPDQSAQNRHYCPLPSVPIYADLKLSSDLIVIGTEAQFKCNDGYELFGPSKRTCQSDQKWSGTLPYCAVNVAYGKPTNQSSTIKGGDSRNANDGHLSTLHETKYCTETKVENSPWWQVDLLQPYEIRVIRLLTRGCCGHQPLHDLEIRVGNSSIVQGNRLCAWYPGTLGDGENKDFHCANPIIGRYVYIQMVGIESSLSLCEVFVFTTKEFSSNRCGDAMEYQQITSFNQTCYEFQTQRGGSFTDADAYCKSRGGSLIHSITEMTQNFLYYELERYKAKLRSKLVWVGARRDHYAQNVSSLFGTRPRLFWHWINGQAINRFLWAEDQPNNYNGQQNCIVLDGGRKWLWNDVTCDLDYLPWICQYSPSNCGSPEINENSTIITNDFRIGNIITYKCAAGCRLDGSSTRLCRTNGFWDGEAPKCSFVDCGPLESIPNGKVSFIHTYFNASARYSCQNNYALIGAETRYCLGNGSWSHPEPKCYYGLCSHPPEIDNGIVHITNQSVNGIATYICNLGFVLVGNSKLTCQIGGTWSSMAPQCKFIDCRLPLELNNGYYKLINKTTYFESIISYECEPNYYLIGNKTRSCTEFGTWSGLEPRCEMINCGPPKKLPGVRYIGDYFTVNSELTFECESGHQWIDGSRTRVCQENGQWNGNDTVCKYVECGRVQPIWKGEIIYVNLTTHLGSVINYSCGTGYKIVGDKARTCQEDGRWSGNKAKCEEIRCPPPEIPKNSSVVYNGNDRSFSDSFKVGSTVQYRCSLGHIVQGQSLRTCETTGHWSDAPPICVYIDCGLPSPLSNAKWLLSGNTTHYGSTVEYECNNNYKLNGPRRRICLENETWSGVAPVCELVNCNTPELKDDKTLIQVSDYHVGGKVIYSCKSGLELVGNQERICLDNGLWSGQTPHCRYVDCGRPPVITNGRGYLVNGTTFYGSIVEYHCLPDFKMISDSQHRYCQADGEWSGTLPRCLETQDSNEIDDSYRHSLESESNYESYESSKSIGIGVSFGIGTILILMIIIGFLFIKIKKQKPLKNSGNIEVNHHLHHHPLHPNHHHHHHNAMNKENLASSANTQQPATPATRPLTYSRICLENDVNNLSQTTNIRNNSNLVTFTSPQMNTNQLMKNQPLYANLPMSTTTDSNIINVPVNQNLSGIRHNNQNQSHQLNSNPASSTTSNHHHHHHHLHPFNNNTTKNL
ncbi:Sushi, von Willebrand factor type A, EGF and pentraxin domain-containing protein 1 [Sarcoptes scabiei]|uniref:Sushi, von Willebrand factor type A, EGF and pentraxin domain-containing protein 1 n=1 Tax=Sarcoptes scabiei TaxID=52283 RepID=A0A834R5D3_SARSC|nr:Sushi, von Willebrand factor type A, EGF and pentraxin domain-containing protein 1 [Sarcoptes scabiei]